MDMVWMLHPQLPADQLICQPEEAVIGHRTSGWQVTDPPPPDEEIEGPWGEVELSDDGNAAVESRPVDPVTAEDGKE